MRQIISRLTFSMMYMLLLIISTSQLEGVPMIKQLQENTVITTKSNATCTVEKGWFVSDHGDYSVINDPEQELTIVLTAKDTNSLEETTLQAWKAVYPDFSYTILHRINDVAKDGWDEIMQLVYDTPSQHSTSVVARRHGQTWHLLLFDGPKAAIERRMAGLLLIHTSFKISGVDKERFDGKKAHTFSDARLQEFSTFVEETLKQCDVPGAAIGLVQNNSIRWTQGFGTCELGATTKVTPETLFMIGSTTKPLTTLMIAMLIDLGYFTWDTPVQKIMPSFTLGDATMSRALLMKHLVSANTGIPRHDAEYFFNSAQATPESRLADMKKMIPTTGFGETFQYSNSMVAAGGFIAASALDNTSDLGTAYDTAMHKLVFKPLGMDSSTFDFDRVCQQAHAQPHELTLLGKYVSLPIDSERWVESIRPAGGLWSTVNDMCRYMITELQNGINADGERVMSADTILKRRESQIQISNTLNYGLCLMIDKEYGIQTIGHDGSTLGFTSLFFFLPEHNVGLVVLTNARGAVAFTQAVKRKFFELLFDGKSLAEAMVTIGKDQYKKIAQKNAESISKTVDSTIMQKYAGMYSHPTLGAITLEKETHNLKLDVGSWHNKLGQKIDSDGTLKLVYLDAPFAGLEFSVQEKDDMMHLILEIGQHKYQFDRQI